MLDATASEVVVASELAREAAHGNALLGEAVKGVLQGVVYGQHLINGRNDYINWIIRV